MRMNNRYYFESSGYEFESYLSEFITLFARREWGSSAVKFSTDRQDRFEGTDIFVLGIPVDITLDFARKNKTRLLGSLELDGVTIDLGIRFGNGRADFKTPVLVIGAESACGITKQNMWVTLDTIKSNILNILDLAMDKYLQVAEV